MSWRNKLSWRWIIRGTCLGLLGLCVGLWGLSYFYHGGVGLETSSSRGGTSFALGRLVVFFYPGSGSIDGLGCSGYWDALTSAPPFSLRFLDGDFLGFVVDLGVFGGGWEIFIPFWFCTTTLSLVAWVAWRKTRRKLGLGFPIEPLASRQQPAGES